jgi:adenine/guanine/hypoxanthine permease
MFKADLSAVLNFRFFGVLLSIFAMALIDTMGSLIAVSSRAGFLDERGNLPRIAQPMLCDALATVFAALAGTTTSGAFIESAAGVQAGGRTGLTAVFIAALFILALFFAPLVTAIPPAAYGPALVIIGSMMMAPIAKIDFDDPTESIPAFAVIALISFTYNIGVGITAGLVLYPIFKLVGGAPLRSPWHCGRSRPCRGCSSPSIHTPRELGFRSSLVVLSDRARRIEVG